MSPPYAGSIRVRVPATSANLGPGFDALGLALDIYDDVEFGFAHTTCVHVDGEGVTELPRDGANLVAATALAQLTVAQRRQLDRPSGNPVDSRGVTLRCTNRIPHGRGLGSSAAAIVAGVLGGQALAAAEAQTLANGAGETFAAHDLLALAAAIEGHPDNVAACVLGGATIAWREPPDATKDHAESPATASGTAGSVGGRVAATRLDIVPDLRAAAYLPPHRLDTVAARAVLPAGISHRDAVFAATRAALLVHALTAEPRLLYPATEDRLHQAYRAGVLAESMALVRRFRAGGHAAVLSGAGPAVLILHIGTAALPPPPPGWRRLEPAIAMTGATVSAVAAPTT